MKVKLGDLTKIKTGKLDANASSEDGQYHNDNARCQLVYNCLN